MRPQDMDTRSAEQLPTKELVLTFSLKSQASFKHPERNEDAVGFDASAGWVAVFDGVGGVAGGEEASKRGLEILGNRLAAIPVDTANDDIWDGVREAFEQANREIRRVGGETTAVAVKIAGDKEKFAYIGIIGDSRLYLFRDGRLERITEDYSLADRETSKKLDTVKREEDLAGEELIQFRRRNIITGDLKGSSSFYGVDEYKRKLVPGDVLVLTSDGVHDNLTTDEIEKIISEGGSVRTIVDRAKVRSQEGHFRSKTDDISAVVIEVGEEKKFLIKPRSSKDILRARNFDELYEALNGMGEIKGTHKSYTSAELQSLINLVRAGKLDLKYITRTGELRKKVKELLKKEQGKV